MKSGRHVADNYCSSAMAIEETSQTPQQTWNSGDDVVLRKDQFSHAHGKRHHDSEMVTSALAYRAK
jgi:hypothetical protein